MSGALDITGREAAIAHLVEMFRPCAIPCSPFQDILLEAAARAGWRPPPPTAQQRVAGHARSKQRQEAMMVRRVLVAIHFRRLSPRLRERYSSVATASAIIRQLDRVCV